MEKFLKAAGFLRSYIASNGRFDLMDIADRAGLSEEVDFLKQELVALLDDELNTVELYEVYCDEKLEQKAPKSWVEALTSRWF